MKLQETANRKAPMGAGSLASADDEEKPEKVMYKSKMQRALAAPVELRQWLEGLADAYNSRLLQILVAAQFVLKGFVMSYSLGAFDWLMSARNVPGPTMQIYSAIGMLPFAMKPLIGMMSDAYPILGYQKNPYLIITTMLGLSGLTTIALSEAFSITIKFLVIALFCIIMMISSADVLTEAKYAERIREVPEKGPDLITFVWLLVTAGGLLATLTLGLVLEHHKPHVAYGICLLPAAAMFVPTILNYLDEKRLTSDEVLVVRKKYFQQWELATLVTMVGVGSIIIMLTGLLQDNIWVNLSVGLSVGFVVISAFLLLTAPIIGKMVAFGFIQHLCAFNTMGAVFYFFTNGPEQYPEGPHFSPLFLISIVGVVGSCFSFLGFSLFNLYMKHWKYHPVFLTTNIVYGLGHALSAIQFSRLNLKWGISDEVFAISYAVVTSISMSMLFLPSIVLLTQLCPKSVEATMYALLAGVSNLGAQIGGSVGAAVLTSLGVTPQGDVGESHKFENLWIAALISSFAPMVTLILLPWMIPNAYQTERLMAEDATAVDGSPWRRYSERRAAHEESLRPRYGATSQLGG